MLSTHPLRIVLFAAVLTSAAAAQCQLTWQQMVALPGTNKRIKDVVAVPGGDLYACGWFSLAGSTSANRVARWDGTAWHALGQGLDGSSPEAIIAMPNGDIVVGGGFLMAGGQNIPYIARWDGTSWSALGSGFNARVNALHLLPNGDLLAGGSFTASGATPMSRLARWDGSSWHAASGGIDNGTVWDIASLANGDVAVGGTFTLLGGAAADGFGVWDGAAWTAPSLGSDADIYAIAALPGGDLVVGGKQGPGVFPPGPLLATYGSGQLTPLSPPITSEIWALMPEANGDLVVAGGQGVGISNTVARLSGGQWTVLDNSWSTTFALAEYGGELLAAGGPVGNLADLTIRTHDGASWSPVGAAGNAYRVDKVVADTNAGVFVGGYFDSMVGVPANHVAHWDGANWSALGAGVNDSVTAMGVAPNGDLIVGGNFTMAGGAPAAYIARWNGLSWSTLGAGLPEEPADIAVMPDGKIVAVGNLLFEVQMFDGTTWSQLPPIPSTYFSALNSVVVMPDSSIVVTGSSEAPAWRYDSGNWTMLGTGFANVSTLAVGANGELYRIGHQGFGVYEWSGSSWLQLGASTQGQFRDLVPLPNGDLVAVGSATFLGGVGRWDGNTWQAVDGGIGENVGSFATGSQAAWTTDGKLVVGGSFATIGNVVSLNLGYATSNCEAVAAAVGSGCSGGAGPVSLQPDSLPWLGATHEAHADGMTAQSLAVLALGAIPALVPLPSGAPGCSLLVQPDVVDLRVPFQGTVDASFDVPADPALVGGQFRTQIVGIELGPGLSIVRLTSSNALELTIGAF